jgi:hypothetical protein
MGMYVCHSIYCAVQIGGVCGIVAKEKTKFVCHSNRQTFARTGVLLQYYSDNILTARNDFDQTVN